MTNELGGIIIILFAFERKSGWSGAGCQWVEFSFCLGLARELWCTRWWRLAAGSKGLVGGDELVPVTGRQPVQVAGSESSGQTDRQMTEFSLRTITGVGCARLGGLVSSWIDSGDGCSLRPDVGSLHLTFGGSGY